MDMFSALAEPTRRDIIELLAAKGQLSAGDIYIKFPVSAPAISQHLKVLRQANLVRVEKRAQQRIYQINPRAINQLEQWIKKMTKISEDRFSRLDKILAREKKR